MEILFNNKSVSPQSPTFMLKEQRTLVATGLAPGDEIVFEMLTLAGGRPADLCGCILTPAQIGQISAIMPLMCPTCESDTPQRVRLTERNPAVVLDFPMGVLLRAVYVGTGLDDGTVVLTMENSSTQDLTPDMRGCPPVCCEDEPQTWEETGQRRCNDATLTVEVQQISNCGNYRWVADPRPPTNYWVRTGARQCNSTFVQYQEQNPCGELRWVNGEAIAWVRTGTRQCGQTYMQYQETNQCGDLRWVDDTAQPVTWVRTGETQCGAVYRQYQETNQCGDLRWVDDVTQPIAWTPTGVYDCIGNVRSQQQISTCNTYRWVSTGEPCGDSVHTITSITVAPLGDVFEGEAACWQVRLNTPVVGTPLSINFDLSGSEQDVHGYPDPSLIIYPGSDSGVVCVSTIKDNVVEGTLQLCLSAQTSSRITAVPAASCVNVVEDDYVEPSVHIGMLTANSYTINEGEQACWTLELDSPVAGEPLVVETSLSGDEQGVHNYPAPSITIPVGQSTAVLCVQTNDDGIVEDVRELCLDIIDSDRLTAYGEN